MPGLLDKLFDAYDRGTGYQSPGEADKKLQSAFQKIQQDLGTDLKENEAAHYKQAFETMPAPLRKEKKNVDPYEGPSELERWKKQIDSFMKSGNPTLMKEGLKQMQSYRQRATQQPRAGSGKDDLTLEQYQSMTPDEQSERDRFEGHNFGHKQNLARKLNAARGNPDEQIRLLQEFQLQQRIDLGSKYAFLNADQSVSSTIDKKLVEESGQKKYGANAAALVDDFPSEMDNSDSMFDQLDYTRQAIGELFEKTDYTTTGIAAYTRGITMTPAMGWAALKDTVISRLALDELKALKSSSKVGASGMGALSTKELEVLQRHLDSLNQAQKPDDIKEKLLNMNSYLKRLQGKIRGKQTRHIARYEQSAQAIGVNVDPSLKHYKRPRYGYELSKTKGPTMRQGAASRKQFTAFRVDQKMPGMYIEGNNIVKIGADGTKKQIPAGVIPRDLKVGTTWSDDTYTFTILEGNDIDIKRVQ